jgi:hypothetical protein
MAEPEPQTQQPPPHPLSESQVEPVPELPKGIAMGPKAKAIRDSLVQQWDATAGRDHDEVKYALKRLDDELVKRAGIEETSFLESELNERRFRQVPVPGSEELGVEVTEVDARGAVRVTPPGPEDVERTRREKKFAADLEDNRLAQAEVSQLRRTAAQLDDELAAAAYSERADKLERIVTLRREQLRKDRVQQHLDDGATEDQAIELVFGSLAAPGEMSRSIAEPAPVNPRMDEVLELVKADKTGDAVDAYFALSDRERHELQQQKDFDEVNELMLAALEDRRTTAQ